MFGPTAPTLPWRAPAARLGVDRTFVDAAGVRWIVDYKTSAHEGGAREGFLDEEARRYRDQMESYAGVFRKTEQRETRLARILHQDPGS